MQISDRNKLVEENMGLVGKVIKDRVRGVNGIGIYTYDDLYQIGCVGLCKAADAYVPGSGCFSTFAYILIRNEIFDALEYATLRRSREAVTDPDELPFSAKAEPLGELRHDLSRALDAAQAGASGVTAKGIAAIRLLAEGYTCREIGERMGGASANNVSAWVSKARRYLRARPDIAALEG
jgi:RNA polymerase sigma factor (sigma-70 family)